METNKIYLGDSYKLIKEIPDKSIDLIYTDIPYLIEKHGYGSSTLGNRLRERDDELLGRIEEIKKKADELKEKMDQAETKEEYEKWHAQRGNQLTRLNLLTNQDITKGIDYKILDEFVRVMKNIYIYIYGVQKSKSTTYCNFLWENIIAALIFWSGAKLMVFQPLIILGCPI